MPKKFKGENSKAQEARARKAAVREAEKEKLEQAAADEYWKDDDKHIMKKQQRKDDKEKKRIEQIEKKKENEQLLEAEMETLKSAKPAPTKVTRAEIEANKQIMAAEAAKTQRQESNVSVDELPIEENVNRMEVDGDEARGVDEAISVLSVKDAVADKHPERRVKAAYLEYEERNLPILKRENPNLRLSQLKQMLKKDWMKSPENPLNQR